MAMTEALSTDGQANRHAGMKTNSDSRSGFKMKSDDPIPQELLELRASIDNVDAALVYLLAERFKYTQKVGRLKAKLNLPSADPTRESAQIERLRALAHGAKLDPDFAEKFLSFIIREVIRHHESIRAPDAAS